MTVALHAVRRGEGPPLVVLHGLFGAGNNWSRHAQWLAERYRVILPDLRNHGRSPHHPEMGFTTLAEDVVALLDGEGAERVRLVGHSLGGKVAMTLALTRPERVAALAVVDIAPIAYRGGHAEVIDAMRRVDLATAADRETVDAALAEAVPEAGIRQFLLTNLQRRGERFAWRIPLDYLAGALPTLEGFPPLEADFRGPTAFLHGARSGYFGPDGERAARRHFPAAEIIEIPEAGHFLHVERPEAFAEALGGFLERAERQVADG